MHKDLKAMKNYQTIKLDFELIAQVGFNACMADMKYGSFHKNLF